jgi:peptidoglycan-associated lipoprotein
MREGENMMLSEAYRVHTAGRVRARRATLVPLLAVLALSSACARRPEIVGTAPPSRAAAPPAPHSRPDEPPVPPAAPALAAPQPDPGGLSRPDGPERATVATPPGPGEQRGPADRGPERAVPLPPGAELIAPPPAPPREEPLAQASAAARADSPLKDIFYDFDKAEIRQDARVALDDNMRWLKANPKATITIEGHCDERGSSEYNLGLGQRRAKVARDYLVSLGIDGRRIATVSYGKERPFVLGHDESAWRWNRRAHFVLTGE